MKNYMIFFHVSINFLIGLFYTNNMNFSNLSNDYLEIIAENCINSGRIAKDKYEIEKAEKHLLKSKSIYKELNRRRKINDNSEILYILSILINLNLDFNNYHKVNNYAGLTPY